MRALGPEGMVAAVRQANFRTTQLGAAGSASTLDHVTCPDVSLDMASVGSAMLFEGAMATGLYTITAITRCPVPGHSYNFASTVQDGCLAFYPPASQVAAMIPGGYANATLTIPEDRFLRSVETCFPEIPAAVLRRANGVRLPAAEFEPIRRLIAAVRSAMDDPEGPLASPQVRAHLEADLLDAFLNALREGWRMRVPPPGIRLGRRYQLLAKARELLNDHRASPLPVASVCAELGLSRRNLEYLFHDLLGISPAAYLKCKRMNEVRAALLRSAPTRGLVKRLALEGGFWHLGHFANDYCKLFGESPVCSLGRHPDR